MKTVVVRNIPRADAQIVASLRKSGTSTVHEAMGRIGLMKPYLRPIYPGDVIVANDDGVVVLPLADARRVSVLAHERVVKESANRKRYESGELALDINNMRPALEKLGLRYVDNAEQLNQEEKGKS